MTPIDPTYRGITFYNRTADHTIEACYNTTGASGYLAFDGTRSNGNCGGSGSMTTPSNLGAGIMGTHHIGDGSGTLMYNHADGLSDGINKIEGVRAFNSDSGAWTTPDAFAGDVDDPMSQKSYVWNKDNPIPYEDPSGYVPWSGPSVDQDMQALADGSLFENDTTDDSVDYASDGDRVQSSSNRYGGMLKSDPGFDLVDEAARMLRRHFMGVTQATRTEWGGRIVCNLSKTACGWTLSPDSGNHRRNPDGIIGGEVDVLQAPVPQGTHTAGYRHDHWLSEMFSGYDSIFPTHIICHFMSGRQMAICSRRQGTMPR